MDKVKALYRKIRNPTTVADLLDGSVLGDTNIYKVLLSQKMKARYHQAAALYRIITN